jgi:plastocyanin
MRSRALLPIAGVSLALVAVIATGSAFGRTTSPSKPTPVGPGDITVEVSIRHSRFSPGHLAVRPGTTITFVVHNDDPIGHEFIIGDDAVHRRHEAGTEPVHPPRPGEVSIPALSTAETTFTFEGTTGAGSVLYACHLPGHFRYGMSGTVDVVT